MAKKLQLIALRDKHVVAARRTTEIPGFEPIREWVMVEVVPFGPPGRRFAQFSPVFWRGVHPLPVAAQCSREEAEQYIIDVFQGVVK